MIIQEKFYTIFKIVEKMSSKNDVRYVYFEVEVSSVTRSYMKLVAVDDEQRNFDQWASKCSREFLTFLPQMEIYLSKKRQ